MGYVLTSGATGKVTVRGATFFAIVLGLNAFASSAHAITATERLAQRIITKQINSCFEPPPGTEGPYPKIQYQFNFNRFGALSGPAQIISSLDGDFENKTARRVVRAASRCVTLKYLVQRKLRHGLWKRIRVKIRPIAALRHQ